MKHVGLSRGMRKLFQVAVVMSVALGLGTSAAAATSATVQTIPISQLVNSGPLPPSPCTSNVTIKSLGSGYYVRTDVGGAGYFHAMLHAVASAVGNQDLYTVCQGLYTTIQSQANGMYVAVEPTYPRIYTSMLRARSSAVGAAEKFALHSCGTGCVAIRSYLNDTYVANEFWYSGTSHAILRARSGGIGQFEKFQ
ncbi:fascin domain-containing protein [Rhizohabitans arisaemae]|uniref:fascin domain-containing protein n=1 Tax=Rhizohabitans arisaemae TaxID=2720610 RepID=UPI0024B0BADA|nr:hypothetical protein [Rhizohabitans arisaemae]